MQIDSCASCIDSSLVEFPLPWDLVSEKGSWEKKWTILVCQNRSRISSVLSSWVQIVSIVGNAAILGSPTSDDVYCGEWKSKEAMGWYKSLPAQAIISWLPEGIILLDVKYLNGRQTITVGLESLLPSSEPMPLEIRIGDISFQKTDIDQHILDKPQRVQTYEIKK